MAKKNSGPAAPVSGKGSRIVHCSCVNAYQDARYGKGNRVACNAKDGSSSCTVCGTAHR